MASSRGRGRRREHVYRRPKDRSGLRFTGSHHCPVCGKWCYRTRDDAERAVRKAHPGAIVHYYQCESTGHPWWHYTSMAAWQVEAIRAERAVPDDAADWVPELDGEDGEYLPELPVADDAEDAA